MGFRPWQRARRLARRSQRVGLVAVALAVLLVPTVLVTDAAAATPPVWLANALKVPSSPPLRMLAWGGLTLSEGANEVICRNVSIQQGIWNEAGHGGLSETEGLSAADCTDPELERTECEVIVVESNHCGISLSTEMPPLKYHTQEGIVCRKEGVSLQSCPESEREQRTVFTKFLRRTPNTPWSGELVRGQFEEEEAILDRIGIGAGPEGCYPKEKVVVEGKEVERPVSWEKVPAGCLKIDIIAPRIPLEVVYYGTLETVWVNGSKTELFPSSIEFGAAESTALVSEQGGQATLTGQLSTGGTEPLRLIQAR